MKITITRSKTLFAVVIIPGMCLLSCSCKLDWNATISEVDGYVVEMSSGGGGAEGTWKQIGKTDESNTSYTTKKLSEGQTFSFRVTATSLTHGSSKPLETDSPVTTKNPFRKGAQTF